MKIVLASQSPRRHELLTSAGIEHIVRVANIDETAQAGEDPVDYVRRMAREKALAVDCSPDEIVLAADTTVVVEDQLFGKPADDAGAFRMLRLLSGKRHEVITGICLRHAETIRIRHASTAVWFAALTDREILHYIASGEPAGKAGAYAIQGVASRYIERIEGSYSNVVGLPISLVWRELTLLRNLPS